MAETTIAGIQPALPYYALTPHGKYFHIEAGERELSKIIK
jgi:hypothetical protein